MADISYAEISDSGLAAKFRGMVAGFLQADLSIWDPYLDRDSWRVGLQERIVRDFPGAAFGTVDPRDPAAVAHPFAFEVGDALATRCDPARVDLALAPVVVPLVLVLRRAMDEAGASLVLCRIDRLGLLRRTSLPPDVIRGILRYRPVRESTPHHAIPCSSEDA